MIGLATVATALATVGPASAGAATEFGSNCAATGVETELSFFDLAHSGSEPLPAQAPLSGVITRGKVTVGFALEPGLIFARPQVYRTAGSNQATLVGEGSAFSISTGATSFSTRLPVQAGDHIGIASRYEDEALGLYCQTKEGADQMAYTEGSPSVGSTVPFETADGYRAPISAVIEPDGDHDGFGDETQDACPQLTAFQTPCPLIAVDAPKVVKKKGSVVLFVTTNLEAPVVVDGLVKLGKGRKARLKAGPKTVPPGVPTQFALKFPQKLKNRLGELAPSKKLTLKVTISGTSVAGAVTTSTLKVKLKGQA
jgi:hypothetical protein